MESLQHMSDVAPLFAVHPGDNGHCRCPDMGIGVPGFENLGE